ncbi:hypothetical protein [Kitasatospora sp. NPDC093806]|uniref:hypothetical protein n=1 Tax=Kitasatospora sp. NPDC093806 TaxID=3155075 RepID=UPI00344ACC89
MSGITVGTAENGLSVSLPTFSAVSIFRTYHVIAFVDRNGVTTSGERDVTGTTLRNGVSVSVPGSFQKGDDINLHVQVREINAPEILFDERIRGCKVGPAST